MAEFSHTVGPRSLSRRKSASINAVAIAFAAYAGETVRSLSKIEARLCEDFHAPETSLEQRCSIVRTLDVVWDRRRIVLGIPLPNGPHSRQRTFTLSPDSPVDADLLPEIAESISQATSAEPVSP